MVKDTVVIAQHGLSYDGVNEEANQTSYQTFVIPEDYDYNKQDFTVIIRARPKNSGHVDIYMSKKHRSPNKLEYQNHPDEIIKCSKSEYIVCVYPRTMKLEPEDILTVGFYCTERLKYSLEIRFLEEITIQTGDSTLLAVENDVVKTFRVEVPRNDKATQIIVNIVPANVLDGAYDFQIYVNKGEKVPSPEVHDINKTQPWFLGQAVVIEKGDSAFCTACNLTFMLVASEKNTLFEITTEARGDVVEMKNSMTFGVIKKAGTNITFIFDPSTIYNTSDVKNMDFFVEIEPYSGKPKAYIHYDTQPSSLSGYQWNLTEGIREVLDISARQRTELNVKENKYYITVSSNEPSAFSLSVYYNQKEYEVLRFGVEQKGEVQKDELVTFKLYHYARDDTEKKISINLHKDNGDAQVYVKLCVPPADPKADAPPCELKKSELSSHEMLSKNSTNPNTGVEEVVELLVSRKICSPHTKEDDSDAFRRIGVICEFVIGVYGKGSSDPKNVTKFHIMPHNEMNHVVLKEGAVKKWSLNIRSKIHFKFSMPTDETVTHVNFIMTNLAGIAKMYVSRDEKYPSATKYEQTGDFIIFPPIDTPASPNKEGATTPAKNLPLTGVTYHVTVETESSYAYFSLIVGVDRIIKDPSRLEWFELTDGIPLAYKMKEGQTEQFFRFRLDKLPEHHKMVVIRLVQLQGHFEVEATRKDLIVNGEFKPTWEELEDYGRRYIEIEKHHKDFKENESYILRVKKALFDDSIKGRFVIMYSTHGHVSLLNENLPATGVLKTDAAHHFRIPVGQSDQKLIITKSSRSPREADVFVSLDPTNAFPGPEKSDYKSLSSDLNSTIRIDTEKIVKQCMNEARPMCFIYVTIKNSIPNEIVQYTLSVSKAGVIRTISEGVPIDSDFPRTEGESHRYIFYPDVKDQNGVTISTVCQTGSLSLAATVIKMKPGDRPEDLTYPEKENEGEFRAEELAWSTTQSIYIPAAWIRLKCESRHNHDCGVVLVVKELKNPWYGTEDVVPGTYSISWSSKFTMITPGQPIKDIVEKDMTRYFYVNNPHNTTTLWIQITPLDDGDPDLVVSFDTSSRPTRQQFDWASSGLRGETLHVSPDEFFYRYTWLTEMKGDFVIGVIGNTKCNFMLAVSFEKNKVIDIYDNTQSEFRLTKDDHIYLEYYVYSPQAFSILFNQFSGKIEYKILSYKTSDGDPIKLFEKESNIKYTFKEIYGHQMVSMPAHTDGSTTTCLDCYWIISLEAKTDAQMSILIKRPGSPVYLLNGKALADTNEQNHHTIYSFDATSGKDIFIDITVLLGNPVFYISNTFEPDHQKFKQIANYTLQATHSQNTHLHEKLPFEKASKKLCPPPKPNGDKMFDNEEEIWCRYTNHIFYVLVESPRSSSSYQIKMRSKSSEIILRDGAFSENYLEPMETVDFVFESRFRRSMEKKLSLNIKLNEWNSTDDVHVKTRFANKVIGQRLKDDIRLQDLKPDRDMTNKHEHLIQQTFLADAGDFYITVTNKNPTNPVFFSVSMNSMEALTLQLNRSMLSLLDERSTQWYQIYVNNPGTVCIDVQSCFGSLELYTAQTIEDVRNSNYIRTQSPDSFEYQTKMKFERPGRVFLGIKALSGKKVGSNVYDKPEAYFMVHPHMQLENGPHRRFAPGDEGRLKAEEEDGENRKFRLVFSPIQIDRPDTGDKQLDEKDYQVEYYAIIAKNDENLGSLARCGDYLKMERRINVTNTYYMDKVQVKCTKSPCYASFTLPEKELTATDHTFFGTVRASIYDSAAREKSSVVYRVLEIDTTPLHIKMQQTSSTAFIVFVAALVIGVVGYLLYRHFSKSRKEMGYEVAERETFSGLSGTEMTRFNRGTALRLEN